MVNKVTTYTYHAISNYYQQSIIQHPSIMWPQPITNQVLYCYRLLNIGGAAHPQCTLRYTLDRLLVWVHRDTAIKWSKSSNGWKGKLKQPPKWAQRGPVRQQNLVSEILWVIGCGVSQVSLVGVQEMVESSCTEFSLLKNRKVCAAWKVLRGRLHFG